jgi:hypothetical protein
MLFACECTGRSNQQEGVLSGRANKIKKITQLDRSTQLADSFLGRWACLAAAQYKASKPDRIRFSMNHRGEGGEEVADPLIDVDVEDVEGDVGGCDEYVLGGRVETLQDGEVEQAHPLRNQQQLLTPDRLEGLRGQQQQEHSEEVGQTAEPTGALGRSPWPVCETNWEELGRTTLNLARSSWRSGANGASQLYGRWRRGESEVGRLGAATMASLP